MCSGTFQWYEVNHLGEPVYHHPDLIIAMDSRQLNYKVHRYRRPRYVRNLQQLQEAILSVSNSLISLTVIALFDIFRYPLIKTRPIEVSPLSSTFLIQLHSESSLPASTTLFTNPLFK